MEQYADDLAELLDALDIDEPIVLVGFSMGGYIAWQFVRKYANRLRALVQCDTRAAADTDEARAGRIKMAENVAEWGSGRVAEMMGPKLFSAQALETKPELMAAVRRVVRTHAPAAIAAAQRGMAARPDVTGLAAHDQRAHAGARRRRGRHQPARRNAKQSPPRSPTPNSSKSRTPAT